MVTTQAIRRMDRCYIRIEIFLLIIFAASSLCDERISDFRLCADSECKVPVALGRTLLRYNSDNPLVLSFNVNANVKIYSKSAGSNQLLWGGEINGLRGYFPKEFVREHKILVKDLKFTVPTETKFVEKAVATEKVAENEENSTDEVILPSSNDDVKQSENLAESLANSRNESTQEASTESSADIVPETSHETAAENSTKTLAESFQQTSPEYSKEASSETLKETLSETLKEISTETVKETSIETVKNTLSETPKESSPETSALTEESLPKVPTDGYNYLFQSALNGIQKMATFTNEFPLSLGKLSTSIINNFVTSAQEISEEAYTKLPPDFQNEVTENREINPTAAENTESTTTAFMNYQQTPEASKEPITVKSSIESIESKGVDSTTTMTPILEERVSTRADEEAKTMTEFKTSSASSTFSDLNSKNLDGDESEDREEELSQIFPPNGAEESEQTEVENPSKETDDEEFDFSNETDESTEDVDDDFSAEEVVYFQKSDELSKEVAESDVKDEAQIGKSSSHLFVASKSDGLTLNESEYEIVMNDTFEDDDVDGGKKEANLNDVEKSEYAEILKETEEKMNREDEAVNRKSRRISADTFLQFIKANKKSDVCPAIDYKLPVTSSLFAAEEVVSVPEITPEDPVQHGENEDDDSSSFWNLLSVLMEYSSIFIGALQASAEVSTDFVSSMLPESFKELIEQQKLKLLSPRIFILLSLSGLGITFIFWLFIINKVHRKEERLINQLCKKDKVLFESTTEINLLKEQIISANEKIDDLEFNLSEAQDSQSVTNTGFRQLKDENADYISCIDRLKEEIEQLKSSADYLNRDVDEKDKEYLALKEEYEKVVKNSSDLNEELETLDDELKREQQFRVEDLRKIESLQSQVDDLEESKGQLLREAQVWNERVTELQRQNDSYYQNNEELRLKLSTKENEAQILKDSLEQLKILEEEEDDEKDKAKTKLEKLQTLMDVMAIRAQLDAVLREKQLIKEELNKTTDRFKLLEVEMTEIKGDNEKLKLRDEELQRERNDAVIKLDVLTAYFKQKEIELQRELGVQEAMRQQTEESALSVNEKAALYEQEVALHRSHLEGLKKEMESQARSYKSQIAQHENKAHESWLAARAAERKAEEAKQAAALLRNKLTLAEQERDSLTRIQSDGPTLPALRRYAGSNGEVPSPPRFDLELPDMGQPGPSSLMREPLDLSNRLPLPFLPLDRPLPPPPLGMPPPPPFFGEPPMFDMQGPFVPPPPMLPFDQRLQPPMGNHMGDGRMLPPERHSTPPRDFYPSGMRRPPSGHRYSPPYQFSERHNESERFRESSPLPSRLVERPNKGPVPPRLGNQSQNDRK